MSGIVLTVDEISNIDALKKEFNDLVITINALTTQINELKQKHIVSVEQKGEPQISDIKDDFMAQIPNLNEILTALNGILLSS